MASVGQEIAGLDLVSKRNLQRVNKMLYPEGQADPDKSSEGEPESI